MDWYHNRGRNQNLLVEMADSAPYRMTIVLPLRFEFLVLSGENNDWTGPQKQDWINRFRNVVDPAWDRQVTLSALETRTAAADFFGLRQERYTCPVRFRIWAVEEDSGRDIRSFRNDEWGVNASGQSDMVQAVSTVHVYRAPRPDDHFRARAPDRHMHVTEDQTEMQERPRFGTQQVVAVHEVGHLLGLHHPVEIGSGSCHDSDDDGCYGSTDFERHGIMGAGNLFRREYGEHFAAIASRITHQLRWRVAP